MWQTEEVKDLYNLLENRYRYEKTKLN